MNILDKFLVIQLILLVVSIFFLAPTTVVYDRLRKRIKHFEASLEIITIIQIILFVCTGIVKIGCL